MIYDFMCIIFEPFGIVPLTFTALIEKVVSADLWFKLLSPDMLLSWLFYVSFGYGLLYICFILPFRFLKLIVRAPDGKGRRK